MRHVPTIPHSRPLVGKSEIAAVVRALEAGRLSQGKEVALLEEELSVVFNGAKVVAVSSGTAALFLALAALGLRRTDKVVIPSYTCRSLYAAVALAGCDALCADSGATEVGITPDTVKPLLTRGVKAVIVPHMFGFTADVKNIAALGVPVIEDCAQSAGGYYPNGRFMGTEGDIAILSFYATKLIPAGEGGACITRHSGLAKTIRRLRNCDEKPLERFAFNFKMSDLNAALARMQLRKLQKVNAIRNQIAKRYDAIFDKHSFRNRTDVSQSVCFRYLLDLSSGPNHASCKNNAQSLKDKRVKNFIEKALVAGITCRRPVWEPLHYALGGRCPRATRWHNSLVSVPLYPGLSETEINRICEKIPPLLHP